MYICIVNIIFNLVTLNGLPRDKAGVWLQGHVSNCRASVKVKPVETVSALGCAAPAECRH